MALSVQGLSGTIPVSVSQLRSLSRLQLSGCGLTGTIPDLGSLQMLAYVSLACQVALYGCHCDEHSPCFRTLDVSNNQLSGTIPDSTASLLRLQVRCVQLRECGEGFGTCMSRQSGRYPFLLPFPRSFWICLPTFLMALFPPHCLGCRG
jgi:hypothetical protein